MKIVFMEPLGVSQSYLDKICQPFIEGGHELEFYQDISKDPEELYRRAQSADIIVIANNPLPGGVIEGLDKLKLIDVAFTGVDHVDLQMAKAMGISVSNASGYASKAVAELSIGLTLSLYRHLNQLDQAIRLASKYPGPIQGREISGKVVGIIGTGDLGIETARLYKAFGAQLIGYNRSKKQAALDLGLTYLTLEEVMAEADIISIHLPLNDQTQGIISKEMINKMKKPAVLINVARGPIVDNHALAEALNNHQISGAGIDVYDMEPPLDEEEPLLKAKNTVLTPHIGYLTMEAMENRAQIVVDNALKFIDGQPQNIIE